jgi:outer membrane protein OmpA-like peptidoglycan-associated protein
MLSVASVNTFQTKTTSMKKIIAVVLAFMTVQFAIAQKPVKDHYTVSGGLLGAANFSKFNVSDNSNVKYDYKFGWGAGGWLNIPLGHTFSLEPQVLYNSLGYKSDQTVYLADGSGQYISVPVLLKVGLGKNFALTAGPQFDFLMGIKDKNNNNVKEDFTGTSISGNFGLEVFPHARVTPFARYIIGFTNMDNTNNPNVVGQWKNSNIQAGLKFRLFGKHIDGDSDGDGVIDPKDKCPTVVGLARYDGCPIPDTDGDGINDEEDKCPSVAGLAKYGGCPIPDTDKDGINDEQDKCPTVAGLAKYGGCPIPDSDKDGLNDEEDKCPTVAGLAKYQGCPIPDTDNDGVNDEEDKCPTIAGPAENGGCPKINFNAAAVQFVSGSCTLTTGAKAELNKLVKILNEEYPDVKIAIEGHTDNTGKAEKNQSLSECRANAVKSYLVSKKVAGERLSAAGFGQDKPVADNTTKEGQAKNRRVEFHVSQ